MIFLKSQRGALFLHGAFVAFCAGWLLLDMLTSPSEQENAMLLELSLPRLILALGVFLTFIVFSTLALHVLKNPSYRVGWPEKYWLRIQPVMLFDLLAGITTLAVPHIPCGKSA